MTQGFQMFPREELLLFLLAHRVEEVTHLVVRSPVQQRKVGALPVFALTHHQGVQIVPRHLFDPLDLQLA